MMGGAVTAVIHVALSAPVAAVVLRAPLDAGTGVVISV